MHAIIAKIADPVHHQKWMEAVNNTKIPFEGKYRKGYCIPFAEEVKFYAVRIKKEAMPEFLAREHAIHPSNFISMDSVLKTLNGAEGNPNSKEDRKSNFLKRFIQKSVLKFCLFMLRQLNIKQTKPAEGEFPYYFQGHHNTFVIGTFDDIINKQGQEEL